MIGVGDVFPEFELTGVSHENEMEMYTDDEL